MYMMYGVVILVGVVFIGLFVAQAVIFSGNGRIAAAEEYLTSHTSVWEDKAGEYTLSFTASGENGVFRSKDGEQEFSVSFGIPGTMHFKGPSARNDDEALSAHWRMDKEKENRSRSYGTVSHGRNIRNTRACTAARLCSMNRRPDDPRRDQRGKTEREKRQAHEI